MKFELTILGCGSAVPTVQRNAPAQVLNVLERYFLIDCGEGTQYQLRKCRIPYTRINHIFISHLHGDHFFGLIGFLSSLSLAGRKTEMHIYADARLPEIINAQLRIMHSAFSFPVTYHTLPREQALIYEDKAIAIHTFPLKHRPEAPANGFLFVEKERGRHIIREMTDAFRVPVAFMHRLKAGEDFVTPEGEIIANHRLTRPGALPRSYAYMSDTLFCEQHAAYVRGVDLLFHESTYGRDYLALAKSSYHSTAEQAATIAREAGAGRLILGHFSSRYPDPTPLQEEARGIFPATELCADGIVFSVPLQKV